MNEPEQTNPPGIASTSTPKPGERRSRPGNSAGTTGLAKGILHAHRYLLGHEEFVYCHEVQDGEPEGTEGLAPVIRQEIWAAIRDVKGRGQAILIVDKNLKDLLPLADACVILEKGASVWHGSAAELAGDAALQDRFLGI